MKYKKSLLLFLLLPVLTAMAVFIGVNVADYCRYRYIMNLDKHLTATDFEAMVQAAKSASVKERESMKISGSDMPAIFKKIGAKTLSIYHYVDGISATAVLYERGKPKDDDWRVYYTEAQLRFDLTKGNQKVYLMQNFSGWKKDRALWVAIPALEEQNNPTNRIFTLHYTGIGTWTVLPDAIIYSGMTTEGVKTVKQSLTVFQSDAIGGAIDMIPPKTYGKMFYDKNIIDGERLTVVFSRDGQGSIKDIFVNNSWCPELEPLLKMLNEFAPHAEDLPTKKKMVREYERQYDPDDPFGDPPVKYVGDYQTESIEKWRAHPPLQTDWWIVWPRLFLEKPKVVLEVPPGLK